MNQKKLRYIIHKCSLIDGESYLGCFFQHQTTTQQAIILTRENYLNAWRKITLTDTQFQFKMECYVDHAFGPLGERKKLWKFIAPSSPFVLSFHLPWKKNHAHLPFMFAGMKRSQGLAIRACYLQRIHTIHVTEGSASC